MSNLVARYSQRALYDNNTEIQAIYNAQGEQILIISGGIDRSFYNNFIIKAGIDGIRRFEVLLGIIADEALEDIEFRRTRVLNRLGLHPPYTRLFLEQMLTSIFGAGNWEMEIDPVSLTFEVYVETADWQTYDMTMENIRNIIPANLGFISASVVPYTHVYLRRHYTHDEMSALTQGELSQFA